MQRLPFLRFTDLAPLLALLLSACSGNSGSGEVANAAPPTGHYEGAISYQGSELRTALDLRETKSGQLTATLSFPQLPGLEFEAATASYQAPQLRLEEAPGQPGGIVVQAVREGDFLRGILNWDSVRADFVWVRRGEAPAPDFRDTTLTVTVPGQPAQHLRLLLPDDTLPRHPALVLLASAADGPAAARRATHLARRGIVALLLPPAATDSGAVLPVAALAALRRQAAVDSGRVGYWGRGTAGPRVAEAAGQQPQPGFVVLEAAAAATRAEASAYQVFNRQRIPVLAYYAGLDTTVQAAASARRLRPALGYRRGTQVLVLAGVTVDFQRPGRTGPDGQWQWPQPATEYWNGLIEWLKAR
ncbi:hypothetical protein [Hymenobacter lapidiphilus]|uniref:Dienelactone hydrolase domain-containing protein n=1 Tax=Hymenobacter lapidiphilus TaxID=2608003 RepID=A0A7Y7PLU0_9BACT|nr:hypothetical protein [Hymenobacter lapidiphilus]NVO30169.1 hypothetical protein [Hymenobacter lapidiphilus]